MADPVSQTTADWWPSTREEWGFWQKLVSDEHDRQTNRIASLREALETAEAEARRYAENYPQSSDGRNTFIMLADRIAEIANG